MSHNEPVHASMTRRAFVAAGLASLPTLAMAGTQTTFRRIPTQYLVLLGEPEATSGSGAQHWGIWTKDPGPRGVPVQRFDQLMAAGGRAAAQWTFDKNDWWLDENGLLMENPVFKVPHGKYVVTGDREPVGILTIHPKDFAGDMRWELDSGVRLHDVTHLPCRAGRYQPATTTASCSPKRVDTAAFPVKPGGLMPSVEGCAKRDYTVLFVIGIEAKGQG